MLGRQERWQDDLFVACSLCDLIPDDHILKRVDEVLDLSWLRGEVADCYCEDNGRPGIDPEAAVRLMLAGLFEGITRDRHLMRQAQVNIAIRWFAGYRLDERLPHHSSLTRIRQRWGEDRFRRVFLRTVTCCNAAGLIGGDVTHVDATLIRADVSWESLTERHVEQVLADNRADGDDPPPEDKPAGRGRKRTKPPKTKKYSPTDPDATLTTSCKQYRMEPCYKQHTAVDDCAGVIVDVAVTTGEASEGAQLLEQIGRVQANTGRDVKTVTADGAYAHARNYMRLENAEIEAVIPPQRVPRRKVERIPARRFRYDGRHKVVRCPGGKVLQRSYRTKTGWAYRSRAADCRGCPLCQRCFAPSASSRTIAIPDGYEALLRARRRKERGWDRATRRKYTRHRWRAEGSHGEAKTLHGLRRAARRGMWNVAIQAYLTAAVMNLKRLAAALGGQRAVTTAAQTLQRAILGLIRALTGLQHLFAGRGNHFVGVLRLNRSYQRIAA
jgi:transposase